MTFQDSVGFAEKSLGICAGSIKASTATQLTMISTTIQATNVSINVDIGKKKKKKKKKFRKKKKMKAGFLDCVIMLPSQELVLYLAI